MFIERIGKAKPPAARREQRSLFAPKSARILRVMLNDPSRAWKVVELAEHAGVSLGQVSNVRQALLDREWGGTGGGKGFSIAAPQAVLDAWRQAYRPPRASRRRHYTLLHGAVLDAALRAVFAEAGDRGKLLFASFSAARWLAPFARVAGEFFYADAHGEELLKKHLRLEPASRGENVVIDRPRDDGVYFDKAFETCSARGRCPLLVCRQSNLMPDSWMTLAHFATSVLTIAPNCSGVFAAGSRP